ncbi:long-chain-fatty-acid--CoA ligase [Pseudomonas proteolytica]|uniref:long-chain-fatty-acid--CoA ligase n=1 Tax=Pseudomonas proteolytica TaxID=219574 RepID=UPI001474C337|nr:long-chain-fatty-acid--CoA ligase [Pseudomonas proteolytica]NMY98433.1 AMP-binding protein [Pseudomonas proteolytica]
MFNRHLPHWPEGAPHHLTLPDTSLFCNLEISARRYPQKTAIIYYDTLITYAQLLDEVERLAGYFQSQGVKRGDRVLLFMQNSPQFIITYYAALRADAMVVPLNPMSRASELEHYLHDTDGEIVVCAQDLAPFVTPLLGHFKLRHVLTTAYSEYLRTPTDLPLPPELLAPVETATLPGVTRWQAALDCGQRPGPHLSDADDHCVMPYSSGTTGVPKGCLHTHGSVMATTVHRQAWTNRNCEDVVLTTLPLFHVAGMQSSMNGPIFSGACVVVMTRWNREVAAQLMQRYRVSNWSNIVTMAVDFLTQDGLDRYDLSSLNYIGGGGAAMPGPVKDKLKQLLGLDYIEGYGMTETMAATHMNPKARSKSQCLGIPAFDVDSRVIDSTTGLELAPHEVGEIVCRGPQVFKGYWRLPQDTEKAFIELEGKRFLRTGDLGYYDEDGYFFMVDRIKRMINASGYKVWPSEVESLMYRHPAIKQCCVISSPDARRGEAVKALVTLHPGQQDTTASDIIEWCKANMSAYKVPVTIEFREHLPQSGAGKLLWRQLQDEEWAAHTPSVTGTGN